MAPRRSEQLVLRAVDRQEELCHRYCRVGLSIRMGRPTDAIPLRRETRQLLRWSRRLEKQEKGLIFLDICGDQQAR